MNLITEYERVKNQIPKSMSLDKLPTGQTQLTSFYECISVTITGDIEYSTATDTVQKNLIEVDFQIRNITSIHIAKA